MSDCKHEKRSDYVLNHPRYVSYCQHCDADFTKFELETLERAEKAEARVKELEDAIAAALRIKQLWGPSITGDVMENRALYIMLTKFEELVK